MLENIQQWISSIIETQLNSPLFFLAILFLGFVAAIGSCCNLGVIGAVTSYAGTQTKNENNKNSFLKTGFAFLIGNVISLSLVGALTGFVSQTVGKSVGDYWTLIAGIVVIYFGLSSLELLPFSFKVGDKLTSKLSKLANKGFIFGLALGGFATACSACCNPIFPIILGASYLQGELFWSWFTLFVFAIGYSIPLSGILIGLGFGLDKFSDALLRNKKGISTMSGIILILIGFGLLLGWV